MLKVVLLSSLGFVLALLAPRALAERIEILPVVRVEPGKPITLFDLVQSHGVNADVHDGLKKVKLSEALQAGERMELTNTALSQWMRQALGTKGQQHLQLRIPQKVIVETLDRGLNIEQISDELVRHWQKLCEACEVKVSDLSLPALPDAQKNKPWRLMLRPEMVRGSFSVPVEVDAGAGQRLTYWISGRVSYRKQVAVSTRSLNVGERLQPADLALGWRDVTYASDGSVEISQLLGRKLKRGLRAQEIIWAGVVEKEKALSRGDVVKATVEEDGWQLSLSAVAEQDGFIGDTVKVKNKSSNMTMSAVVIGKGEVKVQ